MVHLIKYSYFNLRYLQSDENLTVQNALYAHIYSHILAGMAAIDMSPISQTTVETGVVEWRGKRIKITKVNYQFANLISIFICKISQFRSSC